MGKITDVDLLEWEAVRPDVARGVYGKTLLDGGVKLVLTRVQPGGGFTVHRDGYSHLLYFIGGSGKIGIGGKEVRIKPGLAVRVEAGEEHWYTSSAGEELMLLAVNLPDR
jgi:mannose-6-phosphate isomerase-like protein (cupin superfamily)